jgi:hypothetical protein
MSLIVGLTFSMSAIAEGVRPFVHPGLLHSADDLRRMRRGVMSHERPWIDGWSRLVANRHAGLDWKASPQINVYRGSNPRGPENYGALYNDMAAAYALGLRWRISEDSAYAEKAVAILDAWSVKMTSIDGSSDKYLASGIYGYQMANAAELLHDYAGWKPADQERLLQLLLRVFYPMNHDFLVHHNGAKIDHYWANWDLANLASMLAIGIFANRRDIYDEAIGYFKHGAGNGSIDHVIWKLYPGELGQVQESGRDQGHANLVVGLLGVICQMAWNQGDDLFGFEGNRVLQGAEYVARYNLDQDVPYTPYRNSDVSQPVISSIARGDIRPIWELIYNHYVVLRGLSAPSVEAFAHKLRPEGGGGDYGPNSGGFDQLGYGTLVYSLKREHP